MIDIQQSPDGDILLPGGDITYTESTGQHKRDLLLSDKGHFKESPETGVGTLNFLNDTDPENFYRTARKECSRDGMKVKNITLVDGQLEIDADYEDSNH